MENKLQAQTWPLGKVVLKVEDLEMMTGYYQEVVGLSVLKQDADTAILGIKEDNRELVELVKIAAPASRKRTAGLFHLALLLPSRADLGAFLHHMVSKQYRLEGASDHGYSEALYFTDPEGNGIEIYADKPKSEWDIRPNGEIAGITIAMDAEGVYQSMKQPFTGMPSGTVMGHVHLTVNNLDATERFYQDAMGISLKYNFSQHAKFFAYGEYHHHLGSNTWGGVNLPAPEADQPGLAAYTWEFSQAALDEVESRLKAHGVAYTNDNGSLVFKDNSGITVRVELA